MLQILQSVAVLLLTGAADAAEFDSHIPMRDKGAATFYVEGDIHGVGAAEFMVDTGSGYMTINEDTLAVLQRNGDAVYLRQLSGVLADGSTTTVPVYRVTAVRIGEFCTLRDVEAVVFPGSTRQILGMSALRQAAPFIFSMNPPQLVLSHCTTQVVKRDDAGY